MMTAKVSIHALTWRATQFIAILHELREVSIHALTWRATSVVEIRNAETKFQSTPSHGGRLSRSKKGFNGYLGFNPRPHMEGDLIKYKK